MKTNILLITVLCSISFCLVQCKTESKPEEKSTKSEVVPSNFDSTVPTSCLYTENRRDGSFIQRINAICADSLIHKYQQDVDALKALNPNFPNIDNLLVYGGQVELSAMQTIMDKLDSGTYDEVYTMMAAVPGKASSMIFVLTSSTSDSTAFYNFTQPCPSACPDMAN